MAKVKVYFIPKSRDRAAAEFCTYDTHNVKELYHLLTQKYGDGTLRGGPKKWFFLRSSMIELEDGEYEFWESLLGTRPNALLKMWSGLDRTIYTRLVFRYCMHHYHGGRSHARYVTGTGARQLLQGMGQVCAAGLKLWLRQL